MFGLGFWELIILAIAVLVFVPPRQLPKVFRKIGRVYGEIRSFNKTVRDTMRTIERESERQACDLKRTSVSSPERRRSQDAGSQDAGVSDDTEPTGTGFNETASRHRESNDTASPTTASRETRQKPDTTPPEQSDASSAPDRRNSQHAWAVSLPSFAHEAAPSFAVREKRSIQQLCRKPPYQPSQEKE